MLVSILYNSTMYLLVQRRVTQIGENNGTYFKLNVNLSSLDQMNIHIALKNLTLNLRLKKGV